MLQEQQGVGNLVTPAGLDEVAAASASPSS